MHNYYDDPVFFEKYSQMSRSAQGLAGAGEWPTLRQMLPDFSGKAVLDLGCGYGWHCLYAAEHGAKAVHGVDLSERMLATAREKVRQAGWEDRITLEKTAMEDYAYPAEAWDVVLSSLALHYVPDFAQICRQVYHSSWICFWIESH